MSKTVQRTLELLLKSKFEERTMATIRGYCFALRNKEKKWGKEMDRIG
jgi:hypothetical protein